jgi:hypothetical protein
VNAGGLCRIGWPLKNKDQIYNTDYLDTKNWKLVNDFTIHVDKELSDRPYMQTKVPKRLWLNLRDVCAVDAYEWSGDNWIGDLTVNDDGELVSDDTEEERKPGYSSKRYITAQATFDDIITVFSIAEGALLQFEDIALIRISAARPEKIGGKNKATIYDGIGFSGMSSKDVPDGGLMEGEPGSLLLMTEPYPEREKNDEPSLQLELFLDAPHFDELFATLASNGDKIEKATMNTVIELFEDEMQASFNEPYMTSEYGLLQLEGNDWVSARARIDGIQISYSKPRAALPAVKHQGHEKEDDAGNTTSAHITYTDENLTKIMRSISERLGWVIALLVVLIVFLTLAE